ncbi:MAG: PKD domain-containing protein [Thermoplasmatales archaeon]|nr:MAG: PKD domain-containing protein [Thermoplasmatales archaeon]
MKGKKMEKRKIFVSIISFIILILLLFFIPTTLASDQIIVSFDPSLNKPPSQPINPNPSNGTKDVETTVTLSVNVYDETSSTVDAYFYDASDDSLIGVDYNVPADWSTASTTWSGLQENTTYRWYAIANDSEYENVSEIWNFTTALSLPPPPPPDNLPPVANITGPSMGYVNETLIFYANESYDPDGNITGYRWDFNNDGLFDTDWGTDVIIDHIFLSPGNYTIKLQVKDNENATAIAYHNITIIPLEPPLQLPVAQANGPYHGLIYENITFNSTGSYDPDGTIVNYTWYFGDNQTSYLQNPIHAYEKAGNYTIILTVADNDNLTNSSVTKAYITVNETGEEEEEPDVEDEERLFMLSIIPYLLAIILTTIIMLYRLRKYKKLQTTKKKVSKLWFQKKKL